MPHIEWSRRALRDIGRLEGFIADAGYPKAAKRAGQTIRNGIRSLSALPQSGRSVEDLPPDYREWVIHFGASAYIVLYRLTEPGITIAAIRNSREAGY